MTRTLSFVSALAVTTAAAFTFWSARAADVEPVSLRLDWSVISYHMPFYLGIKRGFYRDVGLDLSVQEGKGSSGTVQLVGNGADTFGFADGAVVAKAIGTGIPIKMVMGIL